MGIKYDELKAAYESLRVLRQAYLDKLITAAELQEQTAAIEKNIREILQIPVPPP